MNDSISLLHSAWGSLVEKLMIQFWKWHCVVNLGRSTKIYRAGGKERAGSSAHPCANWYRTPASVKYSLQHGGLTNNFFTWSWITQGYVDVAPTESFSVGLLRQWLSYWVKSGKLKHIVNATESAGQTQPASLSSLDKEIYKINLEWEGIIS